MKQYIELIKKYLMPPRKTILVIDDSIVDRTFVEKTLSRNYSVLTACDGHSGLEAARRHKPDLILLDFMMPDMNGSEVCRFLKEERETEDIPVILLTSLNDAESMSESFEGGAEQYLTKPIRKSDLLDQVKIRLQPPLYH